MEENSHWTLKARSSSVSPRPPDRVQLKIKEDTATPPRLFAVDRISGREKLVLDPNPDLVKRYRLGQVSTITWTDDTKRRVRGLLYRPVNYKCGTRYPLVIQVISPATSLERFNLYGASFGLGPSQSV